MTTERRDSGGTPFGAWLREHPELEARTNDLSVTDSDMWIHKFKARDENGNHQRGIDYLMLIEIKCHKKGLPYAQSDTLVVIDELMRSASVRNGLRYPIKIPDRRKGRANTWRSVLCFGVHVLQLSHERPDVSEQIIWDGKRKITEQDLIELLRFDRDPDYPSKLFNTRRHHKRPPREEHPDMFHGSMGDRD